MSIKYDIDTRIKVICGNIFPTVYRDCTEETMLKKQLTKKEGLAILETYKIKGYKLAERENALDAYKSRLDKCFDVYQELINGLPEKTGDKNEIHGTKMQ